MCKYKYRRHRSAIVYFKEMPFTIEHMSSFRYLSFFVIALLNAGINADCLEDLGCGAPSLGCMYKCPFGFPCTVENDCISGSCTANYCDIGKPAGFTKLPSTTPVDRPPLNSGYWSAKSITSLDNFGHIIKVSYGIENQEFVPDPTGANGSTIKIRYPAKSYKPSAKPVGGTGVYADPVDLSNATIVTFAYKVFFPTGFNFVKGGKLPGLFGGHPGCSGGNAGKDCFSTRFMFRQNGLGELYVYLDDAAQDPDICKIPPFSFCNPVYGSSLGRGAFTFATGAWTEVSQTVTLNTLGKEDGKIEVFCNGKVVMSFDRVVWQSKAKVPFVGIDFETFFGGSDSSWASPTTQYSYFKDLSITYQ